MNQISLKFKDIIHSQNNITCLHVFGQSHSKAVQKWDITVVFMWLAGPPFIKSNADLWYITSMVGNRSVPISIGHLAIFLDILINSN